MVQQGQVFKLKAKGANGQALWAYRYRLEGRGSARPQVGGFASRAEAKKALQKVVERLGPAGRGASMTLGELVEEYLEMYQAEPVTIAKLRWLLGKATAVLGGVRLAEILPEQVYAWRLTIPEGHCFGASMIEARGLTKDYGATRADDELSFTVQLGVVTGFLGPNGAGKSTTMRLILGLDAPSAGDVTVNGKRYHEFRAPLHEVGALLEARSVHTGRSAYHHLLALAQTHGIAKGRVYELIDLVGLHEVARKRAGEFSLGMGQRLGIATALLGDPQTLILDEPVNGLDPEGIQWMRNLLKGLAAEGRTVFVSSHLMSEISVTADHLIVIGRGRLLANASVEEVVRRASGSLVRVRSPQASRLRELLAAADVSVTSSENGLLEISGLSAEQIGDAAAAHGIALHELTPLQASLEQAFMELTRDEREFAINAPSSEGEATEAVA